MSGNIQIIQLLQNLIGNAIKFKDNNHPDIHVCVQEKDTGWLFSVNDNGIGFDKHHQKQIFSIFKRLHREKNILERILDYQYQKE